MRTQITCMIKEATAPAEEVLVTFVAMQTVSTQSPSGTRLQAYRQSPHHPKPLTDFRRRAHALLCPTTRDTVGSMYRPFKMVSILFLWRQLDKAGSFSLGLTAMVCSFMALYKRWIGSAWH